MKKILKRRVIIREYDFLKIMKRDTLSILYDTYKFIPFTRDVIDKELMWAELKGKILSASWDMDEPPRSNIRKLQDYLYNKTYLDWDIWYDENGYVSIQARKNTPISYLGWGLFEKEYEIGVARSS